MTKTLGLVEVPARHQATRLVRSLPLRRFGGKSFLEWVVRRVSDCQLLDQVVVLSAEEDESQVKRSIPPDVDVLPRDPIDPLASFAAAIKTCGASAVVQVRLENPFVDPSLIDRLVVSAESSGGCDYASYACRERRPALLSRVGLFAEWCGADAIQRASVKATRAEDRQDAARFLHSHPELFQLRLVPVPDALDRHDLRLALHVEEDWDLAHVIYEALGPDGLDWRRITGLLDHQPSIRRRMADLNEQAATAHS